MAAERAPLRAVGAEDKPPEKPAAPLTVEQAAASGNHRALLVAMRTRIAKAVAATDCPPRDLAALSRRLQDIAKEIEQLDLAEREGEADGGDVPDEEYDAASV